MEKTETKSGDEQKWKRQNYKKTKRKELKTSEESEKHEKINNMKDFHTTRRRFFSQKTNPILTRNSRDLATMLNRCVTYSDFGLTWEADPRHAGSGLDCKRRDPRRAQSAQSQVHHWTKRNWNWMGNKPSVSAILAYLASDRPDIAFACKECSRAVRKATRADLTRLKRIGRYLLHTPRAVWSSRWTLRC